MDDINENFTPSKKATTDVRGWFRSKHLLLIFIMLDYIAHKNFPFTRGRPFDF